MKQKAGSMYVIRNNRYDEDPIKKLGSGSEGAVYPFPDNPGQCVKLFHSPEPGNKDALDLGRYRAKKIKAICGFGLNLPGQFVLPLEAAYDERGAVAGFLMSRVPPGYVKILELLKPWRTTNAISLKEITLFFAQMFGVDLKELAKRNLAIGDINGGCVMINRSLERRWVDTDSWNYPGFPCIATTELYAHPDLYPNLEKGKAFVEPKPCHDRFALAVMFVQIALHGAHPFRMGTHPKFTSLRERARNKVTVFDKEVTYPRVLPSPEILSDDLLETLLSVLKRKDEGLTLEVALATFAERLTTCKQCGIDFDSGRKHCPKCHEKTMVDMTKLRKLLIEILFKAPGTVLHVQMIEKQLRLLCQVHDALTLVTIDDRGGVSTLLTGLQVTKGAEYRFFGSCLVIVRDPYQPAPVTIEVYHIGSSDLSRLGDVTTGGLENDQALVDTSERYLYRTAGNTLMCGNLFGKDILLEEQVAQVHQTQTWFTVDHATGADREAVFGYDRALRDIQWFVIRGTKDGNQFSYHEVKLAAIRAGEKMLDFAVYFSRETVLLVRKTSYRGLEYIRYSIIRLDGKVESEVLLGESDEGFDCWYNLSGKLFQGDSILHVTLKGIVKQVLAGGKYVALEETEDVVTITDQLFRCGTRVGVARKEGVLTISRKAV